FAWTTGLGDTISQSLNLTTSTAGTYFLTMEDGQNGCRSTDFAVVTLDNQVPMITFGSEVFPCEEPTFTLEAFVMPADPLYEFQWSGQGITGPADELQVVIDTSGWYTFTVHQPQTGCTRTDSVLVTAQTCIPCIELAPVDTLNCLNETVTLSAGFCLPCVGCTLSWADQNGPIPGANDLELTVDTPGTYTLTATDTLGFSSVLTVTVVARLTPPVIDIGPDRLLTCDSLSVTLGSEENILADSLSYQWLTLGGELLASDLSTLAVEIADTFILRVTNLINGCVAMDTAIVRYDTLAPVAEAGPTATLTCETSLVVLDGSASSQNNTSFQWTAPAPGCLQGAQNVNPLAACAGTYQLLVTNLANGCTAADSVEVLMQAELPPLMPLPDTLLTCDNPVIVLNTDVPATGNFTYRWCQLDLGGEEITTTCEFALTYTVSEPGDYRFFLRDEDSGCENSFDVAVGIDTLPPAVDAGTSAVLLCTLDSLQLQGSADALAQLQWQADPEQPLSAENIANPWVQAPGWYYLTATNPHTGCVATDSVFIAQDANLPELQTGQDTLLTCQQPTVTLSATATTTSGQASWSWSGPAGGILSGANSPAPLIQQAGTYWVTVTDPQNTCAVSDSVLVSADFRQPGIAIAGLDTMVLTCAVDTLLLDASLSQGETGAGLSYQWTAFGAGQLFPDLSAPAVRTDRPGNYRLIITDQGNGCRDTLAFTLTNDVALPTVVLPQPALLTCLRDTVILSASGSSVGPDFAYQWLAPDGLEGQGLTFDATLTGYHYLTILDESNGCSRRDSVRVQANRQRPAAQITPPATLTCTVSEVLLDGSGSATGLPYTFAWSTTNGQLLGPTDALTATAGAPGRYQLLVIDERNGCDSLVTVEVLQEGAPITAVDLVVESPPCVGDLFGSISVDEVSGGTPPFLYRLNGGTAGPNVFFEDLSVGTYLLDITDANGCAWQDTIKILPPEAFSVTIQGDTDITLGDSTILHVQGTQPVANLTWQPADLFPLPNEPMPTLVLQEDRFVWVSAINENGCIAGDTVRITVEKIRPLYVPTAFSPNGDGQNDRFTIYAGPEVVNIDQLRIFDRWGNMIFSREDFAPNDPNLGWDGFFEGRRVNSAVFVYLLKVTYVDGWQEMKTGEVMVVW
ncbi:MAG: gliding motility-associated C-terminal domain-containing protein, partial [Lewinella sp.]|nr:gliding motility-associated C-terminal domain-containing protein [Lewinella sp.]